MNTDEASTGNGGDRDEVESGEGRAAPEKESDGGESQGDAGPECMAPAPRRRLRFVSLAFGVAFLGAGVFFLIHQMRSEQTPWLGIILCAYGAYRILGGFGIVPDCCCGGSDCSTR